MTDIAIALDADARPALTDEQALAVARYWAGEEQPHDFDVVRAVCTADMASDRVQVETVKVIAGALARYVLANNGGEARNAVDPTNVADADTRTVTIPGREDHDGLWARRVTLRWVCPVCGGPRGEPQPGISFDGSRRLGVDVWVNPCGHIDKYSSVRAEADEAEAVAA